MLSIQDFCFVLSVSIFYPQIVFAFFCFWLLIRLLFFVFYFCALSTNLLVEFSFVILEGLVLFVLLYRFPFFLFLVLLSLLVCYASLDISPSYSIFTSTLGKERIIYTINTKSIYSLISVK